MTDLTEQWKKGELPEDFYYVISDSEFIKICYVKQNSTDYIKLICSKVPSYKQWQAKLEENTKLKELLKLNNILNKGSKSIYAWLKEDTAGEQKKLCADMFDKTVEMMSEINQAIGEE